MFFDIVRHAGMQTEIDKLCYLKVLENILKVSAQWPSRINSIHILFPFFSSGHVLFNCTFIKIKME